MFSTVSYICHKVHSTVFHQPFVETESKTLHTIPYIYHFQEQAYCSFFILLFEVNRLLRFFIPSLSQAIVARIIGFFSVSILTLGTINIKPYFFSAHYANHLKLEFILFLRAFFKVLRLNGILFRHPNRHINSNAL